MAVISPKRRNHFALFSLRQHNAHQSESGGPPIRILHIMLRAGDLEHVIAFVEDPDGYLIELIGRKT